jgi:hypothetical protein
VETSSNSIFHINRRFFEQKKLRAKNENYMQGKTQFATKKCYQRKKIMNLYFFFAKRSSELNSTI